MMTQDAGKCASVKDMQSSIECSSRRVCLTVKHASGYGIAHDAMVNRMGFTEAMEFMEFSACVIEMEVGRIFHHLSLVREDDKRIPYAE